jgi:8-oxo-dGTP pyrophosphatase MutT (NUDIX family)
MQTYSLTPPPSLSMNQYVLSLNNMNLLLDRVRELNSGRHSELTNLLALESNGQILGYLQPTVVKEIQNLSNIFRFYNNKAVLLTEDHSMEEITDAIAKVTSTLRDEGVIKGWRNELLPAVSSFESAPHFLIERAAVPLFGLRAYGVHVNGFVRGDYNQISHMWVGKRSKTKSLWPSMYDHIVAGGQPHGLSPYENVVKECLEEANIPEPLARTARSAGAVSYFYIDSNQLKRDVLFCYDIELAKDFVPVPNDGEVELFELKSIDWVLGKVLAGGSTGYKPNCNLVIIDFFLR